jgi:predicted O-linked N-acetylglucosamine transferase (SPINDLY family)
MATPECAQWLERGRAHQAQGRAVDALLCYRRALRADARTPEAHYHLGEVLQQLGVPTDAIAAWTEAVRVAPTFLPAQLALAEAHLNQGDAAAARQAAQAVRELRPANTYVAALCSLAELLAAIDASDFDAAAASADEIRAMLDREPSLVAVPAFAGHLARALDRLPDTVATALRDRLVEIAGDPEWRAGMPAALLAVACERAAVGRAPAATSAGWYEHAAGRSWPAEECDLLRRMALAAARVADPRAELLRARHSELCAQAHVAAIPLAWPRRTTGAALRVVALIGSTGPDPQALATIEALAADPRRCDVCVAIIGATALPAEWPLTDAVQALRVLPLPAVPGSDDARRIAALDPDLLLDLAGLTAAGGPLLAQRPARAIATRADARWAHVAPLVDPAWVFSGRSVADLLAAGTAAAERAPGCGLDVAAMSALWNDAVAAHQRDDRDAALAGYAQVLEQQPGYAPAEYLRGIAARDGGDRAAAKAFLAAAIAAAPRYADALVAAARLALDDAEPEAAIALCERGLAAGQAGAEMWRVLGLARLALRDGGAAAAAFVRALALAPLDGETHYNHGVALQMQRDLAGAARAYQRALFFRADLTAAHFNLGVAFQEQGANDAAAAAYETVLEAEPKHVAAHKNLGEVLLAAGRIDRWLAAFERFAARCPTALPLAVAALEACQYLADFARLGRYLEGLRAEAYVVRDETELVDCLEQILYLLLFFDVEPDLVHRFAHTYDAAARRVYGPPLPRAEHRRPGRLRVGYLSADLRDHVMGKMMWSALRHSDRSRFELFFYSLSDREDDWTAKFRGLADRYDVVATLSESEAARRIGADDLDLLVDLSTHTRGSRPGILALKPARVQITHVASAGSLGLSTIDFKLTDRFADLPENQADMIETLLPMAGCVYPYRHVAPAAEHPFQRERFGIGADAFVIGAFVTALKLSRRCLGLWHDVLQRIPRAKLAFSPANPALRVQYARLVAAAGIAADRIVFLPQGRSEAENQARYSIVDVVLDPLPFGGANGTLEALDMGVPVVTLVGRRHGERTAYSMLANLGVEATVAHSGREYVEIAVRLADDAAFMQQVRQAIRERLAGSALTDAPGHMRHLEAAYVEALAARAPESLAGLAVAAESAPGA